MYINSLMSSPTIFELTFKKICILVKALRTRTFHGTLCRGVYRIVAKAENVDQTTECFVRVASGCQDFQLHSSKV